MKTFQYSQKLIFDTICINMFKQQKILATGNKIQTKAIPTFLTLIKFEVRTFLEKERKKNKFRISGTPRS